ncbi:MAG: hypothetical protein MUE70_11420 [Desulfobacterales bacterium]|nr:hypothetical protein [Desulfobacterales bacterium]
MTENTDQGLNQKMPDIIRLIRSVQRIEGNPECFRTAVCACDQIDCCWREYCLFEKPEDKEG